MTTLSIQQVKLRGITKRFPGVLANDAIDFDVRAGEIHALLGENGAGKSTLMRILYGQYRADAGEIIINDKPVAFKSPADALHHGIGMIHQHFQLVPSFTVAENVALGLPSSRGPMLDLQVVSARIRKLAAQYGLNVDPDARVGQLAVGQQQRVEIVKALYRGAALLVLDEPTAVLTPQEVDDLLVILRQMAHEGHALIFISHKLNEALALSQRITVLRDGRVVGTRATSETSQAELARMMVGREVLLQYDRPPARPGPVRLHVEEVWSRRDSGGDALRGVSLDLCAGEIVGLAGVSGNGQRELAESMAGMRPIQRGHITLNGQDVTQRSPADCLTEGQAYIPEERMRDGAIKEFSVAENLILQDHGYPPYSHATFFDFQAIETHAAELIKAYNVKTPSSDTPLKNLSGGNIQKLILARELSRRPSVIIAAQPTRGVDIGATEYIHQQLLAQRAAGTAILLISEDLDEILSLSDRIAVMYEGRIMGVVPREQATPADLGLLMSGVAVGP